MLATTDRKKVGALLTLFRVVSTLSVPFIGGWPIVRFCDPKSISCTNHPCRACTYTFPPVCLPWPRNPCFCVCPLFAAPLESVPFRRLMPRFRGTLRAPKMRWSGCVHLDRIRRPRSKLNVHCESGELGI